MIDAVRRLFGVILFLPLIMAQIPLLVMVLLIVGVMWIIGGSKALDRPALPILDAVLLLPFLLFPVEPQ